MSVDSLMNPKYQNTTAENTLCVMKNKLIDTKFIFMANETSKAKQNLLKWNIQHRYNNNDLLQGKPLPHCQEEEKITNH